MKVGILLPFKENVYEEIASAVQKGFDNAQLSAWDQSLYTDAMAEEVKRACRDFNFTVSALWCGWSGPAVWSYPEMYESLGLVPSDWRAKRTDELLKGADFAYKIGVSDIVTHIGYLPDNPHHPDNLGVVKALKYICTRLRARGQYFLLETGEELPLSLAYLIRDVGADNLGVNFDPANLILNGRGFCPAESLKFLAPFIRGMHAKDALMPIATAPKKIEVAMGSGDADFPRLIAILKEIGYDGYITIEHERHNDPRREQEIMETKKYLEALVG